MLIKKYVKATATQKNHTGALGLITNYQLRLYPPPTFVAHRKKDTVFRRLILRRVHARQRCGHAPKELCSQRKILDNVVRRKSLTLIATHLLHIVTRLGAGLDEHHIQLLRLSLTLFGRHLSLVR